jgi:shikimate kinase|tara:strand:+ start:805 stop:1317 length:513 start_codon:yes stop_codon:yes gene_type:complete
MKSKRNLVLLGMMGSGKSTIGSLLSRELDVKFFDIDSCIEKQLNMRIKEIFEKRGEVFFRNIEEKITMKSLNSKNAVISLGGGAFLNEKIRKEVLSNNFSFWLNWGTNKILSRIKKNKKRPIAFNLNNKELIELIIKRSKIYSKAETKINCNNLTKTEIVKLILKLYEKN